MAGLTLQEFKIGVDFNGKSFFTGIKKFNAKLKGLNKPIKALNNSFNGLFKVAGIAGLTAMTLNAAKLGREMGLISRKTGIAVENISSMQNAFAASGGDAKEISRTLDRITTGLAKVAMGDASFTSSLASMGISAWEDGRLKNAEKVRMDMADWIKQQLDAGRSLAEVATFMNETFGMSQAEVEHLSVGSNKLLAIQKKYNKEIGTLSKEESRALDDINKSVSKLRAAVGITFDKLISESAGTIETSLGFIQDIIKFIQDHKDFFAPFIEGFSGLAIALGALIPLFNTIMAHPLIAMALAGAGIGRKIGKSEEANELVTNVLGGYDFSTDEEAQKVLEMHRKGQIGAEQAGIRLKQLGYDVFGNKIKKNKSSELLYDTEPTLTFPIIGGGEMIVPGHEGSIGNNNTVNVEINTTNNFDGDLSEGDIVKVFDKQGDTYSTYVVKAATGAMGAGD